MSNPLSVRRVKFQNIDEDGNPEGEPSYGIVASDNYEMVFINHFNSMEELNRTINNSMSILDALVKYLDGIHFEWADHDKIGYDNFYGKNWESVPETEESQSNESDEG